MAKKHDGGVARPPNGLPTPQWSEHSSGLALVIERGDYFFGFYEFIRND